MIVADASVILPLVVQEHRMRPMCQKLALISLRWQAPPLWRSEVLSGLRRYIASGRVEPQYGLHAMKAAELQVATTPFAPGWPTLELALSCGLSTYDAQYVQLARLLGHPLVTFDQRILQAAPDVAIHPKALL